MPNTSKSLRNAGDLSNLITFRLARLQAKANAQAARLLKETAGITLSEWRIFVMIESNGKITPTQVIRQTQFDKGLVSRTIKRMHQKGLLSIETNEMDQRSHEIDFTAKGREICEKARPVMRTRQDLLSASLKPDERAALFLAFDKLDAVLDGIEDHF